MKIHVDAGALCAPIGRRYGNYSFSTNLLTTLCEKDNHNEYCLYTFGSVEFKKKNNVHIKKLMPSFGFMPYRVALEELVTPSDVFLSLNQAIPLYTKGKVIAFSHGLAFHFHKNLYADSFHQLNAQLQHMLRRADYIVVSSNRVKQEFKSIAPSYKRVVAIPFGVSPSYAHVRGSIKKQPFYMFVGMDHPIKQIDILVRSFLRAKKIANNKNFKLVLVGVQRKYEAIDDAITVVAQANCDDLKTLYTNTSGLVTTSLYESFNLPVLEALSCGAPVFGLEPAIIPELEKSVYCAKNTTQLTELLAQGIGGGMKVKRFDQTEFSWDRYVQKLMSLF